MKYIKMLGLAAVAAAALMAFAGSASATTLTDGGGNHPEKIEATSTHGILKNALITITCTHSVLKWNPSTGGEGLTVTGAITYLDFTNCSNGWVVTVLTAGTLELHSSGNGNGVLTSTGAEVTATQAGSNLHCIFTASNTPIGTVTGSKNTGGAAVLDGSGQIPRTGGKSDKFCGGTGTWTSAYSIVSPNPLNID